VDPKITTNYQKMLFNATTKILGCLEDLGAMKSSVDQMYAVFKAITDIGIENQNDKAIITAGGKAIAPSAAAHCLLEMKRTAIFLRGIYKAIKKKQAEKAGKTITILYAGTGPYATLITPLLTLFNRGDVLVDLLEINPVSLSSAINVLKGLNMEQFIGSVYLDDATSFIVEKPYDIMISETMQAALKKEPQVSIMNNLLSQMNNETIFIPEEINISACLKSTYWRANDETGREDIPLGNLFTLTKHNHQHENFKGTITLPKAPQYYNQLMLNTTIKVFDDYSLNMNDCTLNAPVKVCELTTDNTQLLHYWYETGETPRICCRFDKQDRVHKVIGKTIIYN
jgi:hypothetical protein